MTLDQQWKLYSDSLACLDGLHVAKDEKRAYQLNREVALAGHADAILAMGWFHLNGVGVERDVDKAKEWYRKSARRGEPRGMFSLGQIAYNERDWSDARVWFKRAADAGHHRSLFWLGKLYWRGRGVELDRQKANQLFHRAATKKVKEAQRTIRMLHARPHGDAKRQTTPPQRGE